MFRKIMFQFMQFFQCKVRTLLKIGNVYFKSNFTFTQTFGKIKFEVFSSFGFSQFLESGRVESEPDPVLLSTLTKLWSSSLQPL